jgi:aminoglycoside phosphotransferase (APT) family kinase protein
MRSNGGHKARGMQVKPEITLSVAQAQSIVDRVATAQRVTRVSVLHGGGIGAIYEIAMREGASLVLKVYPESLHWKMNKEVNVCQLLQNKISVAVPAILLADDTKTILDLNFVLMTKLKGEIMPDGESRLNREETRLVFAQMGRVLREIHDVPMEAFGYIGPHGVWTPYASIRAYISFQFEKKLAAFGEHGGAPELAKRLTAFVEQHIHLLDRCSEARLCHFDFHGSNVLVEGHGAAIHLTGLLDFEGAIAGDPLMDLAKALYYARGEDERTALLSGYGVVDRADWQETVALYRIYCVLELWVWFAQIGDHKPLAGLMRDLEHSV